MAYLELRGLKKIYGNGFTAVRGLDLQIEKGEFVVLLGPSGCGKTTILRMIAGLEQVTDGDIILEGRSIRRLAPRDRNISMIFQSYAVWPHMTVRGNIAYPLKLRKVAGQKIDETVAYVAKICDIENRLDMYPNQLSGGQRQRVAVARAIAVQSKLFLMDEPLSNLDAQLRLSVRTFLKQVHYEYGSTSIFVTHDQAEAMAMADRIVVMNGGTIEQSGPTHEIYNDCDSLFVASFMGTPPANVAEVEIVSKEGMLHAASKEFSLPVDAALQKPLASRIGEKVIIALRPEHVTIESAENSSEDAFATTEIDIVEPQGSHNILAVMLGGKIFKILTSDHQVHKKGENVHLSARPGKAMYFDRDTGKRIR